MIDEKDKLCSNKPEENWCSIYFFRPDGFCDNCFARRDSEKIEDLIIELRRKNFIYQQSQCKLMKETGKFFTRKCCGGKIRKISINKCDYHEELKPEICAQCKKKII